MGIAYQYVKTIFPNFSSTENSNIFFHTFKSSVGTRWALHFELQVLPHQVLLPFHVSYTFKTNAHALHSWLHKSI